MIKERAKLSNDEIIEAYLLSCKRRVKDIKDANKPKEEVKQEKKKEPIEHKNNNIYFLKIASCISVIALLGLLISSTFYPDVKGIIYAIIESLDLFKNIRGGDPLSPSDFVMFIN